MALTALVAFLAFPAAVELVVASASGRAPGTASAAAQAVALQMAPPLRLLDCGPRVDREMVTTADVAAALGQPAEAVAWLVDRCQP